MSLALAAVFTNNMVLQQGMPVPVWGTAKAGATVRVDFQGRHKTAKADREGAWQVTLDRLPASAIPADLTVAVTAPKAAVAALTVHNVLVGEVWVCSGQSNMQWSLALANNPETEVQAAQFPDIRLFSVPQRTSDTPVTDIPTAAWCKCTPECAANFSAVGYFFGRELHRRLGVPIGLINSSWGGTVAEAWTSREGLLGDPTVRRLVEDYERDLPRLAELSAKWQAEVKEMEERIKDTGNACFSHGWADLPEPSGEWKEMELPGTWQSRGLSFSGIVWFRKTVDVPAAWAGQDLQLSIGATDKSDTTYFNNVKVGSVTMQDRPDAWSFLRTYTVPGSQVKAGRNLIAVRVHSEKYAAGMTGPAPVMHLSCPGVAGTPIPLAGTWRYAVEVNYGLVQIPPAPMGPGNPNAPCVLFNAMISPLLPFALRGAIWYQGESNADRPRQYRTLFPTMIRDWRRAWGQELAFYFVQLANYMGTPEQPVDSKWAELREAQTMTLAVPQTGMAVIIDIGEAADIHPRNKQDVGLRLALNALHQTYGQTSVVPCGPLFKDAKREGKAFRLSFDHIGSGLECRGKTLKGFAVAGADRKFAWAEAHLDGDTVLVASTAVPDPVALRYAWADNPSCNLYNKEGLPASPFRTDDW